MLNIRFATSYLLHRLSAKTRHGLHSPFVYRLVDEVIYDYSDKKVYQTIEATRKRLLNDNATTAKNKLLSPRLAQLVYRIAADHKPGNIVELGTSLGITTLYLQQANPFAPIYTLAENSETAAIVGEFFKSEKVNEIEQTVGNINDTLPLLIAQLPQLDFVFVNGQHQKDVVLKYFELCLRKVNEDSLFIVHGIYRNEDMKDAWAQIKMHPQVTITVDLFWMGLVYFRKGKIKEDFKIRF